MKKTQFNKILDLFQVKNKTHQRKQRYLLSAQSQKDIFKSSASRSKAKYGYSNSISTKNKQNSQQLQCLTDRTNNNKPVQPFKIQDFQQSYLCQTQSSKQKSKQRLLSQNINQSINLILNNNNNIENSQKRISNQSHNSNHFKVNTSVRFRPFTINQIKSSQCKSIQGLTIINDKCLKIKDTPNNIYKFDKIFTPQSTDQHIYSQCGRQLVKNFLKGYNATIFAYGQTGSGKTYTMFGEGENHKGIVPFALQDIWQNINKMKSKLFQERKLQNYQFQSKIKLSCSMLQIYRQNLYDLLLDKQNFNQILKIKETGSGFQVKDLKVVEIQTYEQIIKLINKGNQSKRIRQTQLNQMSSRSHLILTIYLQIQTSQNQFKTSKLNLIDLAGSQKVSKSKVQGQGLQQAKKINLSLSILGNTINALVKGNQHIPFRQSKLTKLLHQSLGGNSLTSLIVTCSMHEDCAQQTISSLKFANRAKQIKNNPSQNIIKVNKKDNYVDKFIFQSLKLSFKEKQQLIHQIRSYIKEFQQKSFQINQVSNNNIINKIKNLIDFQQSDHHHKRTLSSRTEDAFLNNSNFNLCDFNQSATIKLYKDNLLNKNCFSKSKQDKNTYSNKKNQKQSNSLSKSKQNSSQKYFQKYQNLKFNCSIQDFSDKIQKQTDNLNIVDCKNIIKQQQMKILQLQKIIDNQKLKLQNYQNSKLSYKVKITANKQQQKQKFNTPQNQQKLYINKCNISTPQNQQNSNNYYKSQIPKQLITSLDQLMQCIEKDKKQYYNFQRQILLCQIDDLLKKINGKQRQCIQKSMLSKNFIDKYINLLEQNLCKSINFIKKKVLQNENYKTPIHSPIGKSPIRIEKCQHNHQYQQYLNAYRDKVQSTNINLEFYILQNQFLKQKIEFYQNFRKQAQFLEKKI